MLGPFPLASAPKVHINRIGAIPKKHQPGKWRMITDMSYPEGQSVNDSIDADCCSMSYITVDEIARTALSLGKGTLFAKIDIKAVYTAWHQYTQRAGYGRGYSERMYVCILVDGTYPLDLSSASKIFNAVADVLEWLVSKEGADYIFHYVSERLCSAGPQACLYSLHTLKQICQLLGIPLAVDQTSKTGQPQ